VLQLIEECADGSMSIEGAETSPCHCQGPVDRVVGYRSRIEMQGRLSTSAMPGIASTSFTDFHRSLPQTPAAPGRPDPGVSRDPGGQA
jgi:hypothetical protein